MKLFFRMLLLCALPLALTIGTTTAYYFFCIYPHISGDLGQLGAIPFGRAYSDSLSVSRVNGNRVIEYAEQPIEHAEYISIGDSFSQQGELGYQNFMAHKIGQSILNIHPQKQPIQAAVSLLNNGFLDSLAARVVIVEIVERMLPEQLLDIDFDASSPVSPLLAQENSRQTPKQTTASIIKNSFNWLKLQFQDSPVYTATLDRSLFTLHPTTLYFYRNDLDRTACTDDELEIATRTIGKLRQRFDQHGIRLLLVIAVDKYDLYQSFIENNPFPKKTISEQLEAVGDTTLLVNTKRLLMPLLEAQEQDLYFANDSHWTQTAAQVIGEYLAEKATDNTPKEEFQ